MTATEIDARVVDVLADALDAYDAGLCVVRATTDGKKRPLGTWKPYQTARPDRPTVEQWFADGHPGVGYIVGAVSGGVEMVEFEGRFRTDENMEVLRERIREAGIASTLKRLLGGYSVWSPSGGMHMFVRITDGEALPNRKLARRAATDAELAENPDDKIKTLIETRGEGGFVVAAPSHGPVHPTGRGWIVRSGSPATIPSITVAERDALYAVFAEFDEHPVVDKPAPSSNRLTKSVQFTGSTIGESWADATVAHVNATETVRGVLERHGWSHSHDVANRSYLTRPGKESGVSGAINGSGRLIVFSSSVPFEAYDGKTMPPSFDAVDVIATYEHAGDRMAALRYIADHTGIYARWTAERRLQPDQGNGERTKPTAPAGVEAHTGQIRNGLPDEFWQAHPVLEHIRTAAWSRMASPDAVLIAALCRYAALVPPTLRLPAIIGSEATFDLIGSSVGDSSAGKSIGGDVATDLLPADRGDVLLGLPVGSGEGLVQSFFVPEIGDDGKPTGRQVIGVNAVHFAIDEGTALMEQSKRQGTTIVQTLCSAWSGRELGQANAKAENRRIIGARRVRVAAVVNMQTANGHLLLTDQMIAVGLPQRITFASAHDPTMPEVDDLPEWPGPIPYRTPPTVQSGSTISVAPEIVRELRTRRHAAATGAAVESRLDGHTSLMRLKIAGLLALLVYGTDHIDAETWRLAGMITDASKRIRDYLVAVKEADDAIKRQRSADGRAELEAHVDDVKERKAVARLADAIVRKATEAGADGVGRADLRRTTTSGATRHRFDDALNQARNRGAVKESDGRIYPT